MLAIRREERTGWMLKYPAVKSHRAPENAGESDSRRRMEVTAGNSVEVSGFRRGVNCATGYTNVWLLDEDEGSAGFFAGGCIRGFKTVEEYEMKSSGFSRGEGAPFPAGQSSK